jgi:hypothetical protein
MATKRSRRTAKKSSIAPTSHMIKKMGPRLFFGSRNVFCITLNMLLVECDSWTAAVKCFNDYRRYNYKYNFLPFAMVV